MLILYSKKKKEKEKNEKNKNQCKIFEGKTIPKMMKKMKYGFSHNQP